MRRSTLIQWMLLLPAIVFFSCKTPEKTAAATQTETFTLTIVMLDLPRAVSRVLDSCSQVLHSTEPQQTTSDEDEELAFGSVRIVAKFTVAGKNNRARLKTARAMEGYAFGGMREVFGLSVEKE